VSLVSSCVSRSHLSAYKSVKERAITLSVAAISLFFVLLSPFCEFISRVFMCVSLAFLSIRQSSRDRVYIQRRQGPSMSPLSLISWCVSLPSLSVYLVSRVACNTLQHTATLCNTLQHATARHNTLTDVFCIEIRRNSNTFGSNPQSPRPRP